MRIKVSHGGDVNPAGDAFTLHHHDVGTARGSHVTFRNPMPSNRWRRSSDMIRWARRRALGTFERDWNYDASHMRDMIGAAASLLGAFALAAPAAAQVSGLTPGRRGALVGAAVAITSLVIGGLALRSAGRNGTGSGRRGAIVALVVGLVGMVLSGLHLATAEGAIGTGSGRAGAIVGLVLGLIGMALSGLALTRAGRTG
jgi:hypothetical protein